ncbi:Aldolase-type TIM barrel [Penicillium manginii]|jgi:alpha-galactosidase|uniref:Aldolase-type TIM barrel n=1 Tax=Penicillium manginii TaxID=203109 RepID=UPI002547252B|nr:Aldolase-type TIM barrel [Penicillium manginii]KAJ5742942.1 Aldolase-type TIM barrel [Penicillium manginii]
MGAPYTIQWHTDALNIDFFVNEEGVICLSRILPPGTVPKKSTSALFESAELPLISVKLAGEGQTKDIKTAKASVGNYLSMRLKYDSHEIRKDGQTEIFEARCSDNATKIQVTARLTVYGSVPVVRAETTVTNISDNANVMLTGLSSFVIGGMTNASMRDFDKYKLMYATNSWFREAQWQEHSLSELGIDNNGICELQEGHTGSQATFSLNTRGSYSTGSHLPMGALNARDQTDTWLWQIESNGSWRWEIGDYKDNLYLAAGGPTGAHHAWKKLLRPGERFTSVPTACCRVSGDIEAAFAALTDYRRQIRRPHNDMEKVPIIFNDYMNCLMGDPDEQKIEALLDPVASLGAEYFVIDAGWYADDSDWWDDVGLWEPSKKRFPSGFKNLLDKIRAKGLIPGLWLEPEVVGVRSAVGDRLPKEAFFQEHGHRIIEKGRFQLDYRHPAVRTWMDTVIYNLVVKYGVGFFKFDYNIQVMQGTDIDGPSAAGAAQLEHQRAYLAWVRSQLDKYPNLVIETCSSGAQRLDYAMLAVHSIQSTSDQQNPALYAAIAAAMPTAVTPEQSGTWAYPQPGWSDEINALTVVNSLLGRVYLSGRVDKMSKAQLSLIQEGMVVYKMIRDDVKTAHATWPLGFPKWNSDWVSLGLVAKDRKTVYVAIWRRGGPTKRDISINVAKGWPGSRLELLYPARLETQATWDFTTGILGLGLPETVCARLFKIQQV